uniref:Uncharacterized protein n=1 Tax=Oryza rufipogon TaxID=4529 RepID=A0A0E0PMQ8_ORYRU
MSGKSAALFLGRCWTNRLGFIPVELEDGDPILLICRCRREVWREHTSRILLQGVLLGVRIGSIFSDLVGTVKERENQGIHRRVLIKSQST